jgi:SAM-dependent methyltransferase
MVEELIAEIGPVRAGRSLLDVGCGPGTVAVAACRAGFSTVGLDSDTSMLDLAHRKHPAIVLVGGALPDLPFAQGQFDAVAANFVVNHTHDPRASVRELARVTRPGGRLALTIWTPGVGPMNQLWNDVLAAASIERPPAKALPPDKDFNRTAEGLTDLLAEASLTDVAVRQVAWVFRIEATDLWRAVVGGIATIGQTYRAQRPVLQERMRDAYFQLTSERYPSGELHLPSSAFLASATSKAA